MQVKAQTEKLFDKRNKFQRQNNIFQTDVKKFYRETGKNQVMDRIGQDSMTRQKSFGKGYGERKKACNMYVSWTENMEKGNKEVKEQAQQNKTVLELKAALAKSQKWK